MTTNDQKPKITLDDLTYFWAKDGLPVFFADRDNIEDCIEDLGFSIYYLLCNIAEDKNLPAPKPAGYTTYSTTNTFGATTVQTTATTGLVKIVNNIVGRSISEVKDEITSHTYIRETAEYNLPAIPFEMITRLDEFFRLVDAQHGTESIVLLTFDPSKIDSSGWGILVPEQTNTSVHCNYNPDSIVAEKPENVLIVGSVHSHPGMAAYASGTDHADQADFDGLHITFGWQKTVNNNATQYYIEMQMGGSSWTLKPDDVFENFTVQKDPDPTVVEWSTKVKKALPPQGGSASLVALPAPALQQTTSLRSSHYQTMASILPGITEKDARFQYIPIIDDKLPHLIIAEIDPNAKDLVCPSCDYNLSEYDIQSGYCNCCDVPVTSMNEELENIFSQAKAYLSKRQISGKVNFYLWNKQDKTDSDLVMKIYDAHSVGAFDDYPEYTSLLDDPHSLSIKDLEDDYIQDGFDPDLTVCCSKSILTNECKCEVTVLYDDVVDFDLTNRDNDVYDYNGKCHKCEFMFQASCPSYVEAILDFAKNRRSVDSTITECHLFLEYDVTTLSIRK